MIVIVARPGGLANQLFLFSQVTAFASKVGVPLMNPSFEHAKAFPTFSHDLFCRFPPKRSLLPSPRLLREFLYMFWRVVARLAGAFETRSLKVVRLGWGETFDLDTDAAEDLASTTRVLILQGWEFLAHKEVTNRRAELAELFTPQLPAVAAAEACIKKAKAGGRTAVGVHIRQGDYADAFPHLFFQTSEYAGMMKRLAEASREPICFVVCSNEPQNPVSFQGLEVEFGPGDALGDISTLARCDKIMGVPSTFTMWASFIGGVPLWRVVDPAVTPGPRDFKIYDPRDPDIGTNPPVPKSALSFWPESRR